MVWLSRDLPHAKIVESLTYQETNGNAAGGTTIAKELAVLFA